MTLCQCGCRQKTPLATKTRRGLVKGNPTLWLPGHKTRYLAAIKKEEQDNIEKSEIAPLCKCGCGKPVKRAKQNYKRSGIKKGQFYKYLEGHSQRGKEGIRLNTKIEATGCSKHKRTGALRIYDKDHPKVKPGRMVPEAHLIVEAALGKHLPNGASVWHFDRDTSNTKNLVAVQDRSYLSLLIIRRSAYEKCGYANWRPCAYCKEYDDPNNMVYHSKYSFRHRGCTYKGTR